MRNSVVTSIFLAVFILGSSVIASGQDKLHRARDMGIEIGILSVDGVRVGRELGKYYLKEAVSTHSTNPSAYAGGFYRADSSIGIVVATDAPLDYRPLKRVGERTISGLARIGASMTNGSGGFAIAFSTQNRIKASDAKLPITVVGSDAMSPLFQAAIEATEEAILNSLFKATTITGNGRTIEALPLDRGKGIFGRYGRTLELCTS